MCTRAMRSTGAREALVPKWPNMNRSRALGWLVAACCACSSAPPSSAPKLASPRVFVETVLADLSEDRIARAPGTSFGELAASHDWTFFSSPHVLLESDSEATVDLL